MTIVGAWNSLETDRNGQRYRRKRNEDGQAMGNSSLAGEALFITR